MNVAYFKRVKENHHVVTLNTFILIASNITYARETNTSIVYRNVEAHCTLASSQYTDRI